MVQPNRDRDIWEKFRSPFEQAGSTLGQAAGDVFGGFASLPGVRHVLGALGTVQERGVNPFMSQVIAGLPIGKEGETRFDLWKTPQGKLSIPALIQSNPLSLTMRGLQGVAAENIPSLGEMRIGPQKTLKSMKLASEESMMESEMGKSIGPTERRMIEEKMYPLAKHVRGGLQELPWFALPPARAVRTASQAARAGQGVRRLGIATKPTQLAMKGAETALKPIEWVEEGTSKLITAPFKAAAKPLPAFRAGMSRAAAGETLPTPRESLPGVVPKVSRDISTTVQPEGVDPLIYRAGGKDERDLLRSMGMDIPEIPDTPTVARTPNVPESLPGAVVDFPENIPTSEVRSEARNIFRDQIDANVNPKDMDINELFENSFARNFGDIAEKEFRTELTYLKNPKPAEMGYRTQRTLNQIYDNGYSAVSNGLRKGVIGNVANKMKIPVDEALNMVKKRFPGLSFTSDDFLRYRKELWDHGSLIRLIADTKGRSQQILPDKMLAKKYTSLTARIPRVRGAAANYGLTRYGNFDGIVLQKAKSLGISEYEIERMAYARNQKEILKNNPDRIGLPKLFDRYDAEVIRGKKLSEAYKMKPSKDADGNVKLDSSGDPIQELASPSYKAVAREDLDNWTDESWYINQGKSDSSGRTQPYTKQQFDALVEAADGIVELFKEERLRLFNNRQFSKAVLDSLEANHKHYIPTQYVSHYNEGLVKGMGKQLGKRATRNKGVVDNGIKALLKEDGSGFLEAQGSMPLLDNVLLNSLISNEKRILENTVVRDFVRLLRNVEEFNMKDVSEKFVKYKVRLRPATAADDFEDVLLTPAQMRKNNITKEEFDNWGELEPGEVNTNPSRIVAVDEDTVFLKGKTTRSGRQKANRVVDTETPVEEVLQNVPYSEKKQSGYFSYFDGDGDRFVWGDVDGNELPKDLWDSVFGRAGLAERGVKEKAAALKAANGFFRQIYVTQNPVFGVRNSMIDMFTTQLVAGVGMHRSGKRIIQKLYQVTTKAEDRVADMQKATGPYTQTDAYFAKANERKITDLLKGTNQQYKIVTNPKTARDTLQKGTMDYIARFIPTIGMIGERGVRDTVFEKASRGLVGEKEFNHLKNLPHDEYVRARDIDWVPKYDVQGNEIKTPVSRGVGFKDTPEFIKATHNATEATLDFQRGGNMVRTLNDYILFLNPAAEGTKLPFRALGIDLFPVVKLNPNRVKSTDPLTVWGSWTDQAKHYVKLGLGDRGITGMAFDNVSGGPRAAAMRMGIALQTYLMIVNSHNKQFTFDETPMYYDVPSYVRYNSMVYMFDSDKDEQGNYIIDPVTGRPKPKYLVFPHKFREWNLLFQIATVLDEETDEDVAMDKKKFFEYLAASSMPISDIASVFPEPFNIIREEVTGRDYWRDRDIVSEEYQQLPYDQQYDKYTSKTARAIAGVLDEAPLPPQAEFIDQIISSPQRLEHLYENIFGTWGSEITNVTDGLIELFQTQRNESDRPMKERVREYREDLDYTEKKEFIVSLTEDDYKEFEKELKESETRTPFFDVLKRSYYPQRGGGIEEMYRSEAEKAFPQIEANQIRSAGVAARKKRVQMKMEQDKDDTALNNWRINGTGKQMTPKEWREAHSKKYELYQKDLESIAERYPKSLYAQTPEVRDAYYHALNTAAGKMKDRRDAADMLIAGYYAIKPADENPSKVQWNEFYTARDEYIETIKETSQTKGDDLYDVFIRRLSANQTDTEKAYYDAMNVVSVYWDIGKSVQQLYSNMSPNDLAILQPLWDRYLNADNLKKESLRKTDRRIASLVKQRNRLRRRLIINDAANNPNNHANLEATMIFWFGADYYRNPITAEGIALHKMLYDR